MAAPVVAASTEACAISSGVIGRCGDIVGVWMPPVGAQVMMIDLGTECLLRGDGLRCRTDEAGVVVNECAVRLEDQAVEVVHAVLGSGHSARTFLPSDGRITTFIYRPFRLIGRRTNVR